MHYIQKENIMKTNKAISKILGRLNLTKEVYAAMMAAYEPMINGSDGFVLVRHGDGQVSIKSEAEMNSFDIVTSMGDSKSSLDFH
jgi:hypothetical protein